MTILHGTFAIFLAYTVIYSNSVPVYGYDVSVRASVGCVGGEPKCDKDISLEDAQRSAVDVGHENAECAKQKRKELKEDSAANRRRNMFRLLMIDQATDCKYTSFIDGHQCNDETATKYSWANVEDVRDGKKDFAKLEMAAKNRALINEHNVYVETLESQAGARRYAICNVRVISGEIGPPSDCVVVAIQTENQTLLRASASTPSTCLMSGSFRLGGTIDVKFEVETSYGPEHFSESFYSLLTKELSFATESVIDKSNNGQVNGIYYASTVGLRSSKILDGGWREAMDFNLSVASRNGVLSIQANTRPLVCREASGDEVDYSSPTDAQKATYVSVLDSKVKHAIKRVCKDFVEIDAGKLKCQ